MAELKAKKKLVDEFDQRVLNFFEEQKAMQQKLMDKIEKIENPTLSEEGLIPGHIDMVMDHTSCTRNEAIKALHESKDNMIIAVMKLTNWWSKWQILIR